MKDTAPDRGGLEYAGLMISTLMLTADYLGIATQPGMPIVELCGGIKKRIEQSKAA